AGGHFDQGLVAPMHPVEVADGREASLEALRHGVAVAADREGDGQRRWGSAVGEHRIGNRPRVEAATLSKTAAPVKRQAPCRALAHAAQDRTSVMAFGLTDWRSTQSCTCCDTRGP